jgi:hypothetical protein
MLLWTQSADTPVSSETGIINRRWEAICFRLEKYSFEKKLQSILNATAGHESNSLPAGAHEYQVLSDEANSLCEGFADRWDLDIDGLRAKIPGLSKLDDLSTPKQLMNYGRLAWFGVFGVPLVLFIVGALAGLVCLGFHLVAGGR